jgi:hypothetical protein
MKTVEDKLNELAQLAEELKLQTEAHPEIEGDEDEDMDTTEMSTTEKMKLKAQMKGLSPAEHKKMMEGKKSSMYEMAMSKMKSKKMMDEVCDEDMDDMDKMKMKPMKEMDNMSMKNKKSMKEIHCDDDMDEMPMKEMKAKPDFLDLDKDGDKEEDMTKAAKDKKMKGMKESVDLGGLFEGQDLSEEFKTTAAELFESAVTVRVNQELDEAIDDLQEKFDQYVNEQTTELKESLVDKIDGYLDFMVEQWMDKNELAINRGIKTEILESFVSGMKNVFESHYIDVPDEKYDLVEASRAEVTELEARLDEEVAKSVSLTKTLKEISRQVMIDEAVEGMAETDAEKFRQLAEEMTYTDTGFEKKLAVIKESYFSASKTRHSKQLTEEFMTDEPIEETLNESSTIDPVMALYLTALERSNY